MIDRYADLAIAIIEQAKRDYKNALQGTRTKEKEKDIKDCETFFLSEWGQSLTFWNGEFVIERCRREVAQARERK
jgi:hypothetical protein